MQLFAGELTNQNQEYYKVNDNIQYLETVQNVNSLSIYINFTASLNSGTETLIFQLNEQTV